jgi:LysR family transcriptional activator of glutamate synthase operon
LRFFEAAVRLGSLSKASEELHISQPSISIQIKSLEEELNCKLLKRSPRKLELTENGEIIYNLANKIIADINEACEKINNHKTSTLSEINLGALASIYASWLPEIISTFKKRHPNVAIKVLDSYNHNIISDLESQKLTMGIVIYPINYETLDYHPFLREEFYLITSPCHPLAGKKRVSMKDIAHESFILYKKGYQTRNAVMQACHEAGFTPNVGYETDRVEIIKSLVSENMGISLLVKSALQLGLKKELAVIPIENPPYRTIATAFHKHQKITGELLELEQLIHNRFKPSYKN